MWYNPQKLKLLSTPTLLSVIIRKL